ncbi:MAG: gluconokinase [Bacteroidota bacterium]
MNPQFVIVMGVSGSGKSTIGMALAKAKNWPFYDADDFHPPANVEKMSAGQPLNDQDRLPWLQSLHQHIRIQLEAGNCGVLACSALKQSYRDLLKGELHAVHFVYLEGSFDLIHARMKARSDHYMPASLLQSQFDALEVPEQAIKIPITLPPQQMIEEILGHL